MQFKSLRLFIISILAVLFSGSVFSQHEQISGVVNDYYKVTSVTSAYVQMETGSDLSTLQRGDKVVLMQMTGWNPFWNGIYDQHEKEGFENTGSYELLAVASVNDATDRIYFTVSLDPSKYTDGEKIQLIKIYETEYAEVTGNIEAKDWDGETGGVIAMVVYQELVLQADIDASDAGFRGGMPDPGYSGICREFLPGTDTLYFLDSQTGRTGNKGEGCVTVTQSPYTNNYTKGAGMMVTGAGGGPGWFAGGGGGGHIGAGGSGGYQKDICGISYGASGGNGIGALNFYGYYRVTMGGGGGSSTEDGTYSATPGGDGGGIVIIIADTIIGNGNSILSRGESILSEAEAGGGGGGAGGAILLDVNGYKTNINVSVKGGKGGNTGSQNTGGGGGGGGGIIWYAGETLSPLVSPEYTPGEGGESQSSSFFLDGLLGLQGQIQDTLNLPLNGFLFNSLEGVDTLCAGQTPGSITGSSPKGGDGTYTYTWLQSDDNSSWSVIGGEAGQSYSPPALSETTYYTRVVESDGIVDSALSVEIIVYPVIAGNELEIRDTLCFMDSPGTIGTIALTGGDGNYNFTWFSSADQVSWDNRGNTENLAEGNLDETIYYYRYVESGGGVCTSTSNIDTISIIEAITGNELLRTDTAICAALDGGVIRVADVSGGDGTYRYQWYRSTDDAGYSPISGATSADYSPGNLSNTYYYQREVASGADDACIDRSESFELLVYPSISDNTIGIFPDLYCYGDQPNVVDGAAPSGGDNTSYTYIWQERVPSETWSTISGETSQDYAPSGPYYETSEVRRIVISGTYDACVDTSVVQTIEIVSQIFNPIVSADENICEGGIPLAFNEEAATGGSGSIAYQWQSRAADDVSWLPAEGTNNLEDYSPVSLSVSTYFRREATSDGCSESGDSILITVYPGISSNAIAGGSPQYTCYNTSISLAGIAGLSGGRPGDLRYLWEESSDNSTWNTATGTSDLASYTSPALTDTMYYRRTVLSGETDQCTDVAEAVLTRINPLPSGDIISAEAISCADDIVPIGYENLTGSSPWSIGLGVDEASYTETGISGTDGNIDFPAVETGAVRVQNITDANGCEADLSGNTGAVDLTVHQWPGANAGSDFQVCGTTATLGAVLAGEAGFWTGTGTFSNSSLPDAEVSIEDFSGSVSYSYQWKEWNWECYDSNTIEITFYEPPEQPEPFENIELDYVFNTELDAPLTVGEGTWRQLSGPAGGNAIFEDSTASFTTATFTDYVTGDYTLQWNVVNGVCPIVSSNLLVSIGEVALYEGFSPNGDGINDEYIINLSGTVQATLHIFDRWGREIITINGEDQIIWDGRIGNTLVPEGTYYYILRQPGIPNGNKAGFIELRR